MPVELEEKEKVLQEQEREAQSELEQLVEEVAPILLAIQSVASYTTAQNTLDARVRQFANIFRANLITEMQNEILRIYPAATQTEISDMIQVRFQAQYKLKGTSLTVDLNQIINRRAIEFKNAIINEYISRYGFNEATRRQVASVTKAAFESQRYNWARIQSNEIHKIQQQATIAQGTADAANGIKVTYRYETMQDRRVRPSHRALQGREYSQRYIDTYGPPSQLNEVNCRCQLVRVQ